VRAWNICRQELDRLNSIRTERAEQLQRLEIERLDQLLASVWLKAKAGNFSAIDRVLQIMQRRAKLLGLDLADKHPATPAAPMILNVTEVVVGIDSQEVSDGQRGAIPENNQAAQSPVALLEE
jgi:hypothetical protein